MNVSTPIKPIEVKAPKSADASVRAPEAKKNSKESSTASEFDKVLESASEKPKATAKKEQEPKAEKEAKVTKEAVEQAATPETSTTTLKAFDQALTEDVQQLIQPKSAQAESALPEMVEDEVNALAAAAVAVEETELTQNLLKTPQVVQEGRAPAVVLTEAEADPKLMNMEDFVAQKNIQTKKNAPVTGYGIQKTQSNKVAAESGLKAIQVVKEGEAVNNDSLKSQQFILNMQAEAPVSNAKANEVSSTAKVFDMNQLKTSNPTEIMGKISDYIMQAKASSEPTVTMRVSHQELGMMDITVQKAVEGSVAINIGTHTIEGKNFFQANAKDLSAHMSQAGINVSDLKIETPSQTAKNDFDMNSQSQSGRQEQGRQSDGSQRRQDSERRANIWQQYREAA
jgi:hypothetical protein